MSDQYRSDARAMASQNTMKQTGWSPTNYHDDRQLFDQLQVYSHLLSTVSQRINEKNVIIHNLQENFNRERSAMWYKISTLKMKLAVEEQKVKMAARDGETSNYEVGENVCRNGVAETIKPKVELEQAEEWRSKSLEVEDHGVQHQTLEPKSQKAQVKVLVQRRPEIASQSPTAAETESWQSARETVSPSVGHAPQQERRQRKRKRTLRGGDCS